MYDRWAVCADISCVHVCISFAGARNGHLETARAIPQQPHDNGAARLTWRQLQNVHDCQHLHCPGASSSGALKGGADIRCLKQRTKRAVLCCLQAYIDESISTCRFAQRVAMVSNTATVNEETDPTLVIKALRQQVRELKDQIKLLQACSQSYAYLNSCDHLHCIRPFPKACLHGCAPPAGSGSRYS